MASESMEYLRLVICVSIFTPIVSWSAVNCSESWVMPCNFTLNVTGSGVRQAAFYDITMSTDICRFHISEIVFYQSITIWCSENVTRITFTDIGINTNNLVIKNCDIFWKDLQWLVGSIDSVEELTLDDSVDEFEQGEYHYFYGCVGQLWDVSSRNYRIAGFDRVVTIHLLSSIARTISEVFIDYIWPYVKRLSIKG